MPSRLQRVLSVGGLAFLASAVAQAVVFRLPTGSGFFAVMVAPVIVGAVVLCAGSWAFRLARPEAVQATLAALACAGIVALLAVTLGGHAFLPFHAIYVALSWFWATLPTALAAWLLPPHQPAAPAAPRGV